MSLSTWEKSDSKPKLVGGFSPTHLKVIPPRKMNGRNLQPSPMKRKENDLNQTSMRTCSMLIFRGVFVKLDHLPRYPGVKNGEHVQKYLSCHHLRNDRDGTEIINPDWKRSTAPHGTLRWRWLKSSPSLQTMLVSYEISCVFLISFVEGVLMLRHTQMYQYKYLYIWVFPKIVVPPNHPF